MSETEPTPTTGRTLAFASLTDAQRAELAKALGPEGAGVLARGTDRLAQRERVAIGTAPVALVAIVALGLAAFADPCWPTQTWIWTVAYAVASAPMAYLVVRAIGARLAARRMPIAPGVYVTSEDVVIAHASAAAAMRVVPVAAIAAVGAPRRVPLSAYAEITIWLEGEPAETLSIPAIEADAAVERLERAREPETRAATAREARRRDPLGEIKRSTAWERAPTARAASELPRTIALAIAAAIALGAVTLLARNALSDRVALTAAIAADDVESLRCYVENGGVHADDVRARALPHAAYRVALSSGALAQLGDYVEAYPDGPDTPAARTAWLEGEYAAAREDAWRLRAFIARFPDAPQVADARARLPRLSLADAIAADDVGSFAFVMREHPGTEEAAEAARRRSARYTRVLEELVARGGRAEAIAFFRALFAFLEANETHDVLVRFRTPSSELLRELDRVASRIAEREVEPIAPSFSRVLSEQREALVFDRLRAAFAQVAPRDVLPVVRGRQLPNVLTATEREALLAPYAGDAAGLRAATDALARDEDDDSGEPEIRIDYEIVPDGRLFTSDTSEEPAGSGGDPELAAALARLGIRAPETPRAPIEDGRAFVGFRVRFVIELRAPATADGAVPERPRLVIEVAPPPSFRVDSGERLAGSGAIYEAMASEAFDRLGAELLAALFGGERGAP